MPVGTAIKEIISGLIVQGYIFSMTNIFSGHILCIFD